MLEPHLAEVKQQGETKLQHPEPLACGKLLHAHYTEKTGGLPCSQMLAPNLLGRHSEDNGQHQVSHAIPPATPRINQHSPLGRLNPSPHKKKKLNNKQGIEN
jgi:hypothetical protein